MFKPVHYLLTTGLITGLFALPAFAQDAKSSPFTPPYSQDVTPLPFTQDAAPAPQTENVSNIAYVTGGIGDEERSALESVKDRYNVRITNAGRYGEFVGDTHIVIRDRANNEILNAAADPLFYAELPAGTYTVEESYQGQMKQQRITISNNTPTHISFVWHSDDDVAPSS